MSGSWSRQSNALYTYADKAPALLIDTAYNILSKELENWTKNASFVDFQ